MITNIQLSEEYLAYVNSLPNDLIEVLVLPKYPYLSEKKPFEDWMANKQIDCILEDILNKRKIFNKLDGLFKWLSEYNEVSEIFLYPKEKENKSSFVAMNAILVIDKEKLLSKDYYVTNKSFFNKYLIDNQLPFIFEEEKLIFDFCEEQSEKLIGNINKKEEDLSPYNYSIIYSALFLFEERIISFFNKNVLGVNDEFQFLKDSNFCYKLSLEKLKNLIYLNLDNNREIFDKMELEKFFSKETENKSIKI